jgi:hypothetical protein
MHIMNVLEGIAAHLNTAIRVIDGFGFIQPPNMLLHVPPDGARNPLIEPQLVTFLEINALIRTKVSLNIHFHSPGSGTRLIANTARVHTIELI